MDLETLQSVLHGSAVPTTPQQATTLSYAQHLDSQDPLAQFRAQFHIPLKSDICADPPPTTAASGDEECIYLCGNSLGLQPKTTAPLIQQELDAWARRGVLGHFKHPHSRPWVTIDENVTGKLAGVVGAKPNEVAVMGGLTGNIHLLLAAFYRPTKDRYKVLIEKKAFPSDHYAVVSHIQWHSLDPTTTLVTIDSSMDPVKRDPTDPIISTAHILRQIDFHADTSALLFLPGVQYYTGQAFDIKQITAYAQKKGLVVGWDLAHAAGNIPLELHAWGVDFAAWCSYKYLNSGPGGISGIFVHEKHDPPASVSAPTSTTRSARHRLAGWWGHDKATRFDMETTFTPLPGAPGYQLSNPSVLDTTSHLSSLSIFHTATPTAIFSKSRRLTSYLYHLLTTPFLFPQNHSPSNNPPIFRILTPADPNHRGAQLSIQFLNEAVDRVERVMEGLEREGVVVDHRKPDVIRVAPAPLYNSFVDCWRFVDVLRRLLEEGEGKGGKSD